MHLLRTVPGLREVSIYPDGEHGKRFDFQGWLGRARFHDEGRRRNDKL